MSPVWQQSGVLLLRIDMSGMWGGGHAPPPRPNCLRRLCRSQRSLGGGPVWAREYRLPRLAAMQAVEARLQCVRAPARL